MRLQILAGVFAYFFAMSFFFAGTGVAGTILVPGDQATIQAGIAAAEEGDFVLVAPGTFAENLDFLGKAITVRSEAGPDGTVIDGSRAGSGVRFDQGEKGDTVLEGFTITNGSGTLHPELGRYVGGAIYCNGASPRIIGCTLSASTARFGGGLYGEESLFILEGSTVVSNDADVHGGGLYCVGSDPTITSCVIAENQATDIAGGVYCLLSSPTLLDCTITENNNFYGYAGGIYFEGGEPVMEDSRITRNRGESGGGVVCRFATLAMAKCEISENRGDGPGGITVFDSVASIVNCSILGNSVSYDGGGIACDSSTMEVVYCTISGNRAEPYGRGGGVHCTDSLMTIVNSIVWGNTAMIDPEISGDPSVTYSDVLGGWPGEGNFDADPLFLGEGDFHLKRSSPCRNRGTDVGVYEDLDGDRRTLGAGFDVGADEFRLRPCEASLLPTSRGLHALGLIPMVFLLVVRRGAPSPTHTARRW